MIIPSPFENSEVKRNFYKIFGEDERAVSRIIDFARVYAECNNYVGEIKILKVYGESGEKIGTVELRIGNEKIMLPYSTLQKEKI